MHRIDVNSTPFTLSWFEISKAAMDKGPGDIELAIKDVAREQVRSLAMSLGAMDTDLEECPEDAISGYCDAMNIRFDAHGNIYMLQLPHYVERMILKRIVGMDISEPHKGKARENTTPKKVVFEAFVQTGPEQYTHKFKAVDVDIEDDGIDWHVAGEE